MRAMVDWFFFSKRRISSRLPATSRPADQADWPAALSTVSAIQALRLFHSVFAAAGSTLYVVGLASRDTRRYNLTTGPTRIV